MSNEEPQSRIKPSLNPILSPYSSNNACLRQHYGESFIVPESTIDAINDALGITRADVHTYHIAGCWTVDYFSDAHYRSSSAHIGFKRHTSSYPYRSKRPTGEAGFIPTEFLTYGSLAAAPNVVTATYSMAYDFTGIPAAVTTNDGDYLYLPSVSCRRAVLDIANVDLSMLIAGITQDEFPLLFEDMQMVQALDKTLIDIPADSRFPNGNQVGPRIVDRFQVDPISFLPVEPDVELAERTRSLAHSKAYKKLAEGDLHLGILLAEAGQTLEFIATNLTRLWKFVWCIIRFDFLGAIQALRVSSRRSKGKAQKLNSWDDFILEYNYALTPLLNDIYGSIDLYLNSLKERNLIFNRSSEVSHPVMRDIFPTKGDHCLSVPEGYNTPMYMTTHLTVWRIKDVGQRTLQELGLVNPLEVIWDKVPFTFLADWIINLDSIMYSITATHGLEFVHGARTDYEVIPVFLDPDGNESVQDYVRSFVSPGDSFSDVPTPGLRNFMFLKESPDGPIHTSDEHVYAPPGSVELNMRDAYSKPVSWYFNTYREPILEDPFTELPPLLAKRNPFSSDSRIWSTLAFISQILKKSK